MYRLVVCLALCLAPVSALGQSGAARIESLAEGAMKKLIVHDAPRDVPDIAFGDLDGNEHRITDYAGQVVLLNFWATWCAPCRMEMPSLSAVQEELGGEDFKVVTLATGPNPPASIRRFMAEEGIDNLPLNVDPRKALASRMAVIGMPISVIIDRDGREIARLIGDADWTSDSARAILRELIGAGA